MVVNQEKPSLQAELTKLFGLSEADFAHHATDLYVVFSLSLWAWLQNNYKFSKNIRTFHSPVGSGWNGAGHLCIDIPFEGNWPNFEGHQKQ